MSLQEYYDNLMTIADREDGDNYYYDNDNLANNALVVSVMMNKVSGGELKMFCENMTLFRNRLQKSMKDGGNSDGEIEYVSETFDQELQRFIDSNGKIEVVMERPDPDLWNDVRAGLKSYFTSGKITIRVVEDPLKSAIISSLPNFTTCGDRMYRLEIDKGKKRASGSLNSETRTAELLETFEFLRGISQEYIPPVN